MIQQVLDDTDTPITLDDIDRRTFSARTDFAPSTGEVTLLIEESPRNTGNG